MGFESYFTLYRKYNTKATVEEIKDTISKYVKEAKNSDYSEEKKSDEEYEKEIPIILDPNYMNHGEFYDSEKREWIDKRDHSVDGQRKNFNYILKDGTHLDELLYWHFGSNFNCISEEFNLGHGRYKNEVIIDKSTAEKILQACNYLLSGKYDDEFERVLDNKWIEILSNGNSGNAYWKYYYRHNKDKLTQIPEDEWNDIEYTILNTRRAMEAYIKGSTNGEYDEDTDLILVYSISY